MLAGNSLAMVTDEWRLEDPEIIYQSERNALFRHMAIAAAGCAVIYAVLFYFFGLPPAPLIHGIPFLAAIGGYVLNRLGYHLTSKIVGLFVMCVIIYLSALSESMDTHVFLLIWSTLFATLVMFGYQGRWHGLAFVGLAIVLHLSIGLIKVDLLPFRNFTPVQVKIMFVYNVLIFAYVSVYSIWMLLRTNYLAEKTLKDHNQRIINQNAELMKTNAELDHFMYSTSRDLKSPLHSLKGLIEHSKNTTDQKELKGLITQMKDNVLILEKFTTDIADHYRNTRTAVTIKQIDIRKFVQLIVDEHLLVGESKKINFDNSIPQDTVIPSDETRLKVILSNIISNSVKFCDEGKPEQWIRISYQQNESYHTIVIEDNGIGINPEHLGKVFKMFYRASVVSKGPGLGLYLVKETIEKLGGRVSLRTTPGSGTVVSLDLPVNPVSELASTPV